MNSKRLEFLGPDLRTRKGVEEYALKVIQKGAKTNFEKDGVIVPAAFVFGTMHPETGRDFPNGFGVIYLTPEMDFNDRGKNVFATMVRYVAEKSKALGLIFITECWTVYYSADKDLREFQEYRDSGESLENHPDRIEQVILSLEHKTGDRAWTCEIMRDQAGVGKLSDSWKEMPKAIERLGRFTGLNYQWD